MGRPRGRPHPDHHPSDRTRSREIPCSPTSAGESCGSSRSCSRSRSSPSRSCTRSRAGRGTARSGCRSRPSIGSTPSTASTSRSTSSTSAGSASSSRATSVRRTGTRTGASTTSWRPGSGRPSSWASWPSCWPSLVGIPLGIFAALGHNRGPDYVATSVSIIGIATPSFVLAILLIVFFAVELRLVPDRRLEGPEYWVLPTIALAGFPIALIARYTRASMLEVTRKDYIRTAHSKGLREQRGGLAPHDPQRAHPGRHRSSGRPWPSWSRARSSSRPSSASRASAGSTSRPSARATTACSWR